MTAVLLDGKALAKTIQAEIAAEVTELVERTQVRPCLATVLVGDDPASEVYVRNKRQACERVGMESRHTTLPATITEPELLALRVGLNADASVHGILVQLPLPKQIDEAQILRAIDPAQGRRLPFIPRTSADWCRARRGSCLARRTACSNCWSATASTPAGKHVVIVGRSDIVGKPLANMLVQKAPAPTRP